MAPTKSKIREATRGKRKGIPSLERTQKNQQIRKKLEENKPFQSAKTILVYVSSEEEVDTQILIKKHLESKRIVVPVTHHTRKEMELCHLERWEDLEPGHFGILEVPEDKHIPVNHEHIDLVIVPGIAFDPQGHRIGYGKGYYDRLLAKTDATTIGLAYECQIIPKVPHEPHDQTVDLILTEDRLINPHF